MKLCCIFLLFATVNVLAVNLEDYIKEVAVTNKYISLAEEYSYPEGSLIPEDSDEVYVFENGLHNTIKNLIRENESIEHLVYMLLVPERVNIKNLQKCIDAQIVLRKAIEKETKHTVPVVEDQDLFVSNDEDQGFKVLSKLGDKRRSKIGKVIRDLFEYAIDNRDSESSPFSFYPMLCRLTGLVKSIENSSLYIIKAEYKEDDFCWLTAVDNSVKKLCLDCFT